LALRFRQAGADVSEPLGGCRVGQGLADRGDERSPVVPDVPTVETWTGLYVLADTIDDLNQPLLNVFLYLPPDRMRPSQLAERASMTKQAMNYLLGQLETRGYIERRLQKGSSRRLVFLTKRGWQVREIILAVVAAWVAVLGRQRFDEFMRTLRQLWSIRQLEMKGARGPTPVQKGGRCEPPMPPRAPSAPRRRRR
jgi:DNA-binding MarR family transcriptional regulator